MSLLWGIRNWIYTESVFISYIINNLLSVFQLSERTFEGLVPVSRTPPSQDKITTGNFWPTGQKVKYYWSSNYRFAISYCFIVCLYDVFKRLKVKMLANIKLLLIRILKFYNIKMNKKWIKEKTYHVSEQLSLQFQITFAIN